MLEKLGRFSEAWVREYSPLTNVYGLARTMIALAMAITFLLNDWSIFFRPVAGMGSTPFCSSIFSIYCIFPNNDFFLNISKWISFLILLIVASGWRPRYTGILHWWVCYSIQNSGITIDGGEQVATVITFLLIPITLLDSRKWHWKKSNNINNILSKIIIKSFFISIRLQVAIIYINAAVGRLKNPEWIDGTALYYYFNDPIIGVPPYFKQLLDPILTSWLVVIPTWGTTIVELLLFGSLFSPKESRKKLLILGLALHISIAILLGLITFSTIMCAALILYLYPIENSISFKLKNTKSELITKLSKGSDENVMNL